MNIKGLKDIPTGHALLNRHVPRTRAQAAFELALLENEKTKLEREHGIWVANQKQIEARLQLAQERCAVLRQLLDERKPRSSGRRPRKTKRKPAPAWRWVTLEY
jgi:hypothetical protein